MPIVPIDDLNDARLADYRNVPDPELLRDRGVFVAEGRIVVRHLLASSRFTTRSVLVSPAALEGLRDALDGHGDLPVFVMPAGARCRRWSASTCTAAAWRSASGRRCRPLTRLAGRHRRRPAGRRRRRRRQRGQRRRHLPQRAGVRRGRRAAEPDQLRPALPQGDAGLDRAPRCVCPSRSPTSWPGDLQCPQEGRLPHPRADARRRRARHRGGAGDAAARRAAGAAPRPRRHRA